MRILHGTWIPNEETDFIQSGSFYLWVETQLSQKSYTNSQQIHPGHLVESQLIAFLVEELGIKEDNTKFSQRISPKYFALPTTNNQPLPSPELTKYLEIELTDSYEEFQYWQIDCYETVVSTKNVTALNIIKLLKDIHFLAIYNAEKFQISSDLLFWYHYTQSFKRTGRSYHADLNAVNRKRRSHYLLEAGWRADNAIQGLGRSHRTNQASAPIFRPVTTNVTGERRFISTIARRLDSLGALTREQRQTGGNGIFSNKDNLESNYAEYALYELFKQIFQGRFAQVPLGTFELLTGLSLTSHEGGMKIDLLPLRQFLNRLLALRIGMQNLIFERFELLLSQQIETAVANGIFEVGVETLRAERFTIENQEVVYTHPGTGSVTNYLKIERIQKTNIKTATEMLEFVTQYHGQLMVNEKSGNAAVSIPTHSFFDGDGGVVPRVLLVRPQKETRVPVDKLESSTWKEVSTSSFVTVWSKEVDELPKFTT
ncbi:MAG: strawberry notch C-terminal domain-containing protein [Nostoc sp.]